MSAAALPTCVLRALAAEPAGLEFADLCARLPARRESLVLRALGTLARQHMIAMAKDQPLRLTDRGRMAASLPVPPRWSERRRA